MQPLALALARSGAVLLLLGSVVTEASAAKNAAVYVPSGWGRSSLKRAEANLMVRTLLRLLKKWTIREVLIAREGDHEAAQPHGGVRLPDPALAAAWDSLQGYRGRDFEVDWLFTTGEERVPVSILRRGSRLSIAWGPGIGPAPKTEGDAVAVSKAYGIGEIRTGEIGWEPQEVARLDRALALLDPQELGAISGVPFVRNVHQNSRLRIKHDAWYALDEVGRPLISILGTAFSSSDRNFLGSPTAPQPGFSYIVLHEVGHALVRAALVDMMKTLGRSADSINDALDGQKEEVQALNAHLDAISSTGATLQTQSDALDVRRARENTRASALDKRSAELTRRSAVLEADRDRLNAMIARAKAGDDAPRGQIESLRERLSVESLALSADGANFNSDLAAFEADVVRLNAEVTAFNQQLADHSDRVDARNDEVATLNSEQEAVRRQTVEHDRFWEEVEQMQRDLPLLQAFGALPGAKLGPTDYGKTSLDEGFAEAFALYRLDPKALGRVAPEILAWFEAGTYRSFLPGG